LTDHSKAAPLCETDQISDLTFAGLIGGRNPRIDDSPLSQLNPFGYLNAFETGSQMRAGIGKWLTY